MRLLLRRTALAVASRRRSSITTEAAADAPRSSSKPSVPALSTATTMTTTTNSTTKQEEKRKKKADAAAAAAARDLLGLDAAAAAFSLSPSAALGLDRTGAAADASKGPRVDHLVVGDGEGEGEEEEGEEDDDDEEEDLAAFVARRSRLSREHAVALLELGAVWWCPVPPPPPRLYADKNGSETAAAAAAARRQQQHAAAEERHRCGRERHGRGMHLFKPRRARAGEPRPPSGSYVRVHVRPKRYFDLRADAEAAAEEEGKTESSMLPTSLASVGYGARAWARRLVALSPEFAVLNKPPCVPSVPTVDNGVEHALSGAAAGIAEVLRARARERERAGGGGEEAPPPPPQRARRHRRPLLAGPQATGEAETGGLAAAHRLDHGASGVLAIGRTPRFVAGFQELSKRGRVAKVYRAALRVENDAADNADADSAAAAAAAAAAASLPRPGDTLVHWAEVGARPHGAPPRTLMFDGPGRRATGGAGGGEEEEGGGGGGGGGRGEEGKERARCELRIVSMKRVEVLPSAAEALGINSRGGEASPAVVWEACILLITGRTHQIRAQMAAVGFPLLGDVLYGTDDYSRVEAPGREGEEGKGEEEEGEGGEGEEKAPPPPPPPLPLDRPIALHAARLAASGDHALRVFGEDPAVFDAGPPWWRKGLGQEDERELERALELRAELEAAATAAAARARDEEEEEGEESSSDGEELVA